MENIFNAATGVHQSQEICPLSKIFCMFFGKRTQKQDNTVSSC